MLKLIIFNSNLNLVKNLCNLLVNEISNLQLSGIANTENELQLLVEKVNPEIIMMTYTDFINSNYSKKLNSNILKILFYNSRKNIKNSPTKLFLQETACKNEILESIQNFIFNYSSFALRNRIIETLESFNFDFKLIGTTYLLDSILYCYENKTDYIFENLEKNVYPIIAKNFNTSNNNVKQSIVRTVNNMYTNISPITHKYLSEYFKIDISEKATAKQLISTIVTRLYN